jgi:hypothetical protein
VPDGKSVSLSEKIVLDEPHGFVQVSSWIGSIVGWDRCAGVPADAGAPRLNVAWVQ